jgi:hypothetical protein
MLIPLDQTGAQLNSPSKAVEKFLKCVTNACRESFALQPDFGNYS